MKNLKSILIALFFIFSLSSYAVSLKGAYKLKDSKVSYHVDFMLKNISSESKESKGLGKCERKECSFLVAAKIVSFNSGDANRDNNVLEYTKGAIHPMIAVRFNTKSKLDKDLKVDLSIKFAGKEKIYKLVPFKIVTTKTGFKANGKFNIKLSDFDIKRPSLLGVSVSDTFNINVDSSWEQATK